MAKSFKGDDDLLVIGYGNTLRQDDQAGPAVAELIESRALPRVRTIACAQLSPEHAEDVARCGMVVFVDAQARQDGGIVFEEVIAGESSQVTTHAVKPQTLLALARDVYGWTSKAWLLTIPADRFGFGEELSPLARRGIQMAVERIVSLATVDRIERTAQRSNCAW